jgi:hypothetical protein
MSTVADARRGSLHFSARLMPAAPLLPLSFTGGLMKRSSFVSVVLVVSVLLGGCSEPCITYLPPLSEKCGTFFCSQAGYCAMDAGPPTCVSKKGPVRNEVSGTSRW